jgi:hypothetical protein
MGSRLIREVKFWAKSVAFIVLIGTLVIFFQIRSYSLFFPPAISTPTPFIPITGDTPAPNATWIAMAEIDKQLQEALKSKIAYNMPTQMELDQTFTIELLLNPSLSGEELAIQLAEGSDFVVPVTGAEDAVDVVISDVLIQDLMRVELRSVRRTAFEIHPSHEDGEQPISSIETTKWRWSITAKEPGQQTLELALYRLIKYHGEEYWREVDTYRRTIVVEASLLQTLQFLDWKSTIGILVTALLIPLFFRWYDSRMKSDSDQKKRTPARKKQNTH